MVKGYRHYVPRFIGADGYPMPDRTSILVLVALVGGSLILTLATMPDKIMIPILVGLLAGGGLVASPDHSFVPLWKESPMVWRIFPCIFVVMVMLTAPPVGGIFVGRLLLGMIAFSLVLLALALAHLFLGERLGLGRSDD